MLSRSGASNVSATAGAPGISGHLRHNPRPASGCTTEDGFLHLTAPPLIEQLRSRGAKGEEESADDGCGTKKGRRGRQGTQAGRQGTQACIGLPISQGCQPGPEPPYIGKETSGQRREHPPSRWQESTHSRSRSEERRVGKEGRS